MRAARPLAATGALLFGASHPCRHFGRSAKAPSPLLTELLLARRRDSQARQSRSAEWREALAGVAQALGVSLDAEEENGQWRAAAAALQRAASSSAAPSAAPSSSTAPSAAADRLFGGDAAADAAELLALLTLMAGGGRTRATAALVPSVAAAPSVLLGEGGVRRAAEVLAALRTRAGLSPKGALAAVERCPPLLGFDPERVRDNCLFLMGATAAATAGATAGATATATAAATTAADKDKPQPPPLLAALALGAPAALGRPPPDLRATWEFLVGGGPAFEPDADLRRWPGALEHEEGALRRRWALLRAAASPSSAASAGSSSASAPSASSASSSGAGKEGPPRRLDRELVEMGPEALARALGMDVGRVKDALGEGAGG